MFVLLVEERLGRMRRNDSQTDRHKVMDSFAMFNV